MAETQTTFGIKQEPLFEYYLFGIYIIELGRFFKGIFNNFQLTPDHDPQSAQVYFGAPRAAFRYYMEAFNGMIKLPMINYNISNAERKPDQEKIVYLSARSNDLSNPSSMGSIMRFPSIYEITYQVDIWTNNLRERDFMMHKLINKMPMGGNAWLTYYPDKINYPDVYLPMSHRLDLTFKDETELDNLDIKESRDRIRTSCSIVCTRAFVPYDVYSVPMVAWVGFESYINTVNGNQMPDYDVKAQGMAVETALIDIGLSAINNT
jgi:hypothetical protein